MDEVTKDILDAYVDQLNDTMQHLVDNKTVDQKDKDSFLVSFANELFKIGYGLRRNINPKSLVDHTVIACPSIYMDQVVSFLNKLQDEHLTDSLREQLNGITSESEKQQVIKEFKHTLKEAGVVYSGELEAACL